MSGWRPPVPLGPLAPATAGWALPNAMADRPSYQCPYCELRFAERWELEHHLRTDHPRAPKRPDGPA